MFESIYTFIHMNPQINLYMNTFALIFDFNPFAPNAPFLYPLKTSENRKGF